MKNMFEMLETLEKNYEEQRRKMYASYEDTEWGVGVITGYKNAIEDLRMMMTDVYHKFFFTFGTDPQYPYGINDYVLVLAKTEAEAVDKFQEKHPNRPRSNAVNCAFWYNEKQWDSRTKQYYEGREPAEVIW